MSQYEVMYPVISYSEDTCGYIDHLTEGLFVASSYAGSVMSPYTRIEEIPVPHIPDTMVGRAGDWGGYRVVKDWKGKAPFSPEQYVNWLKKWNPCWAATWDYPCGDELAKENTSVVQSRQDESTLMAWYFWVHHRAVAWTWTVTVQGWSIESYRQHAQDLYPLIIKMRDYYHARDGAFGAFRVGIGTLVGRKPQAVKAIIDAVAGVLPDDVLFHAWGLKKSVLASSLGFQRIRSSDTGAYNQRFGRSIEAFRGRNKPQRQIVFEENLPIYQQAIYTAVAAPKQYHGLFDMEDAV